MEQLSELCLRGRGRGETESAESDKTIDAGSMNAHLYRGRKGGPPASLVGNLGKEVPYGGWYSLGKLASTEIKMTSEGVQVFNKFMVRPPLK